jgi:hypothetical protein
VEIFSVIHLVRSLLFKRKDRQVLSMLVNSSSSSIPLTPSRSCSKPGAMENTCMKSGLTIPTSALLCNLLFGVKLF